MFIDWFMYLVWKLLSSTYWGLPVEYVINNLKVGVKTTVILTGILPTFRYKRTNVMPAGKNPIYVSRKMLEIADNSHSRYTTES